MTHPIKITLIAAIAVAAIGAAAWLGWHWLDPRGTPEALLASNGRLQAVEVDVAARFGGRIEQIFVDEGDTVQAGQLLARMQVASLQAQLREAQAQWQQAQHAVQAVQAQTAMRRSDRAAAQAQVVQRQSELKAAERRLARSEALVRDGITSAQERDDDRASVAHARAALNAARAQADAAQAAIDAAVAEAVGAESTVAAAQASIERIQADLDDSELTAPRRGRVQYRLAQPGEMLADGGKVLNLIDLSDVSMGFFLPAELAGAIALGSEVRVVLDSDQEQAVPARVSFVASQAQFTPKSVETSNERQKLMFHVKARIDADWLEANADRVKSGLPGVAWVRTDPQVAWPETLRIQEQP